MNFDCNKTYTPENDAVLLKPLEEADNEYLLPFAISKPEIWKYSMFSAAGIQGLKNYLANAISLRNNGKDYPFLIFNKRSGQYAGSTRFYDNEPVSNTIHLDFTWYGKKFQVTGLNRHCKFLMLQFVFEVIGVLRVDADSWNQRSIAAMKSIGCNVEGKLRSNGYTTDGSRRDPTILRILRHEWDESIKSNLFQKLV